MDDVLDGLILGLIFLPIVIVIGVLYSILEHRDQYVAFMAGIAKRIWAFQNFVMRRLSRRYLAR